MAAIAFAASQAERELRETNNLPALAGELRDSAIEDMKAARSIGDELAHLGREAFSLLAVNDVSVESSWQETAAPAPITGPAAETTSEPPHHQDSVAADGEMEAHDLQPSPTASDTAEARPNVSRTDEVGDDSKASEVFEIPPVVAESVQAGPMSAADQLRREFESAGTGGSETREAVGHTNPDPAAPVPGSAAAELERELAALRSQIASTEPPVGPEATDAESGTAPGTVVDPAVRELSSDADSRGILRPGELDRVSGDQPEAVTSAPVLEPSTQLPESYSGRIYLMFPATLTQDELESAWDNLEEVAGIGTINDHRLISRQEGTVGRPVAKTNARRRFNSAGR